MALRSLPRARRRIRQIMGSTVTITFDPEQTGDDVLDLVTGKLVKPSVEPGSAVYAGDALVVPEGQGSAEGGRRREPGRYKVLLPVDEGDVVLYEGSNVHFDASEDAALVGLDMKVDEVERSDILVTRILHCQVVNAP